MDINKYFSSLLDFIYPCECELCGNIFRYENNPFYCINCLNSRIKFISSPYCYKCGKPISNIYHKTDSEKIICIQCRTNKIYFDFLRPVLLYDDIVKKLIYYYKYKNYKKMSKLFGKILIDYIRNTNFLNVSIDYIIPIPLNRKKIKERGFNQSLLLAEILSNHFSWVMLHNCLIRTKYTKPQFSLKKNERFTNIKNAFKLNQKYMNCLKTKNILIIDDISTTNATINECAKEIRKMNPAGIYGLVLAHGL